MIIECRMKKILFFLFAAVLAAGGVEAQEAADSMKIFYRRGYRNVDLSFRDNRAQMERFLNLTEAALKNDRVEKVVIRVCFAGRNGRSQRTAVGRTGGRVEGLSGPRGEHTRIFDRISRRRHRVGNAAGTGRGFRYGGTRRSVGYSRPYAAVDLRRR